MNVERMESDELAAFFRESGTPVTLRNGVWWVEAHPFFFRPLLPLTAVEARREHYPLRAWFGGVQHAVEDPADANSVKRYLVYEEPPRYSMDSLGSHRMKIIRKGLKVFQWRRCSDEGAFIEQAYPVYADFAQRTGYGFKRERTDQREFALWAHTLFRHPKVAVFGAYRGDHLSAVSVHYLVEGTFVHSMYFAETVSQRDQVYDFVLHHLREDAAATDARLMLMGPCTGVEGVDRAKIIRGCTVVTKHTYLRLNPAMGMLLKYARPRVYNRLLGRAGSDAVSWPAPITPPVAESATIAALHRAQSELPHATTPPSHLQTTRP